MVFSILRYAFVAYATAVTEDRTNQGLTQVPGDFDTDTVTELILSENDIAEPVLPYMPSLNKLVIKKSNVVLFPNISQTPALTFLDLNDNKITHVPALVPTHTSGESYSLVDALCFSTCI